ncbi:MAG: CesT family type III secretion system chaperone [Burkholderiaceae bacterium]
MWSEPLKILFKDFCALNGIHHALNTLLDTGTISCNDVAFSLLPHPSAAQDIRILAHFGQAPANLREQCYRRLLEINLLMPDSSGERLAVDPQNGAVIFLYTLKSPSAIQLLHSLQRAAAQAHEWQQTQFLDGDANSFQAPSRSALMKAS